MRKTTAVLGRVTLILAMLSVGPAVFGQDKQASGQEWVAQSFRVKHIEVEKLHSLFGNLKATLTSDPELGLLVVQGPPQTVAFIQETIAKLDLPSQKPTHKSNVTITIYLLGAGREPSGDPELVPVLQPVVNELRERFPYKSYRLLESAVLRVRSNSKGEASGIIPRFLPESLPSTPATFYAVSAALDGVTSGDGGRMIALNELRLSVRLPIFTSPEGAERRQFQYQEIGMGTNLDIREGEMVVVGKAGVQGAVDGIFLVLRAEVVD
jgi:hypothetical protein